MRVPNVVGCIVVVGAHCILFHSDLEAAQMNMQHCLIHELMLYKFELGHNTIEVTKSIFHVKGEGTDDHRPATVWFKQF